MDVRKGLTILPLSLYLAWPGQLQAQALEHSCVIEPRSLIQLGSSEDGVLTEVLVERGDRVEAGQVVAKLDQSLERLTVELARLRAESDDDIRTARIQADYRRKEYQRLEALRPKQVIAERDLDQTRVEQSLTRVSLDAARRKKEIAEVEFQYARAKLERRLIRSPVEGIVTEVALSRGEYAYEQSPLMTVAEIDPLHVEVYLPVARFGEIRPGMKAEVTPEIEVEAVPQATVVAVDRVFDASSRTFGVRLELPNPDYRLPAGLHCTLRFLDDDAELLSTGHQASP